MIRNAFFQYRKVWVPVLLVLFLSAVSVLPVAADDTSTSLGVLPGKSDIANLAFANQPAGYYYFKFNQVGGGGLNALHIASSSADLPNYGDVTTTTSQSGTFYITETGGRGYQDEAILLVAVKGDIPSNFAIHIKSSGYSWTPTGEMNTPPTFSQITYRSGAVDQTFTKSHFVYGSQTWKPAGNNDPSDYPLYYGQDTTDTTNLFKLMFVDLKAGPLGSNGDIDVSTLTANGAVKVEYTIENLDTVATFNTYAWNDNTTQGKGISWANRVVGTGCSGYTVLGTNYVDRASEFPTAEGSTPVYHAPETNFTANITTGKAPLVVQFTDTTAQSVKTWSWSFGDGGTSTEKNPVHTYTTAGTYTVALTGTNGQGLSATKTQAGYITVTSSSGSSSSGSSGGGSSGDGSSTGVNGTVESNPARFTANVTVGIPPLAVRFTDNSTAQNITRWSWDFTGDGVPDSTDQNPVFVFRQIGTFPVSLTVNTSTGETFTATLPAYIRIIDNPSLDSDVGWISSDSADTSQDSGGSDQSAPPSLTAAPVSQDTKGDSPLGTKIAATLADLAIVTVVIGGGLILWRKM